MHKRRIDTALLLLIVLTTFSACMDRGIRDYRRSLSDGRYDSEFPSHNASDEIGAIANSVHKLYSVSYYTTWQFNRESRVLRFHMISGLFTKMSVGTISTQESVSGSATVAMAGGLILAIRDGVPHFELVGMVRSVASDEEYYLRPASNDKRYYEIFPYRGDVYVDTREKVHYGLNFTVPAGKILGFYKKNRDGLIREGYDLDPFFGLDEKQ